MPETTKTSGVDLIAAERQRQIDAEGWTPEHDAEHGDSHLAMAAVCYTLPPTERRPRHVFSFWPWHSSYWKPTPDDRVRELVKAGALIAAEIDRLNAALTPQGRAVTAVDLDALDKLRGAATPGPWERSPLYQEEVWGARGGIRLNRGRHRVAPVDTEADAALIVAAVNALPDLIAEARKYRALREAVEGLAETFDRPVTGITFDGIPQRALFGGGDVCYRLRAVVATVDGEQ